MPKDLDLLQGFWSVTALEADGQKMPAEMVAGGIARGIGFRFDNSAAEASSGKIVDDHFADEKSCECDGTGWQFRAAKTTDGECGIAFVHGEDCYRPVAPLERNRSFCRSSAETRS